MKIIMLLLAAAMYFMPVRLSAKAKQLTEVVFVTDIDCASCVSKIMDAMPYKKGVKDVKVDLQSQSVKIKYDSTKTGQDALISALLKLDVRVK